MEYSWMVVGVGVALEGYVYVGKKSRAEVAFVNVDVAVRRFYISHLESLGFRYRVIGKKIISYSLELAEELRRRIYATSGIKRLPPEAYMYPRDAIRWAFTLDGGVVLAKDPKSREVIFRSKSAEIVKNVAALLRVVGISYGIRGNGTLLYIKRREDLRKFAEIGFLEGAKAVRGRHKGREKNELLKNLLFPPLTSYFLSRGARRGSTHRPSHHPREFPARPLASVGGRAGGSQGG
ncbi:16S rRNA intron-encoded homing endonuclease [Pyrobaculum sp. WP30]|nr:16S rRNA intron-encoded homing endonuclease [Pyrobaculum sp. WP30]